jgi:hypothetical protein
LFTVATPDLHEIAQINVSGHFIPSNVRGKIDQQIILNEFRISRQMVGDHVWSCAGDKSRVEGIPIVKPAGLGNLDFDVRVLFLEFCCTRLIGGQLVIIP